MTELEVYDDGYQVHVHLDGAHTLRLPIWAALRFAWALVWHSFRAWVHR